MKMKSLIAVIALFLATSASAQFAGKGDMTAGGSLMYSSTSVDGGDSWNHVGIGAKFHWYAMDQLVLEPSITYFLPSEQNDLKLSMMDFSAIAQWRFDAPKFQYYPLAGFSYVRTKVVWDEEGFDKVTDKDTDIAFNIGAGMALPVTDAIEANCDLRYQTFGDYDRVIFAVGVNYKF